MKKTTISCAVIMLMLICALGTGFALPMPVTIGFDPESQSVTEGDTFGCEALLSGETTTETVNVLEDSEIMVLGKEDFEELVSKNMVRRINPQVAKSMLDTGAKILDVRYAEEFEAHHIPGCTLIPLHELRDRVDELDPSEQYIVYCHGGSRSAVAVLKLSQQNFDVISLDGGIRDWPYETISLN